MHGFCGFTFYPFDNAIAEAHDDAEFETYWKHGHFIPCLDVHPNMDVLYLLCTLVVRKEAEVLSKLACYHLFFFRPTKVLARG